MSWEWGEWQEWLGIEGSDLGVRGASFSLLLPCPIAPCPPEVVGTPIHTKLFIGIWDQAGVSWEQTGVRRSKLGGWRELGVSWEQAGRLERAGSELEWAGRLERAGSKLGASWSKGSELEQAGVSWEAGESWEQAGASWEAGESWERAGASWRELEQAGRLERAGSELEWAGASWEAGESWERAGASWVSWEGGEWASAYSHLAHSPLPPRGSRDPGILWEQGEQAGSKRSKLGVRGASWGLPEAPGRFQGPRDLV